MKIVNNISLAHVRFLAMKDRSENAAHSADFDVLLGLVTAYTRRGEKGQAADTQAFIINNFPFWLGQTDYAPWLYLAATTDAETLAGYISKGADHQEVRDALDAATHTVLTMDAAELSIGLLRFFDEFTPWHKATQGFLAEMGVGVPTSETGEAQPTISG